MDISQSGIAAALVSASVSLVTATLTALVTVSLAERKLRRDFKLEFAAEDVARKLLMRREWRWRSFRVIRHYLGGFGDDELRKILVRAGAIRSITPNGVEVWGLLSRVQGRVILPNDEPFLPPEAPAKMFGEP